MTIEEVILMCFLLPIGVMAIIVAVVELINFASEKLELKNTIKEKDKIIYYKNREINALKELLAEAERNVQTLLRERTTDNESQNSCS